MSFLVGTVAHYESLRRVGDGKQSVVVSITVISTLKSVSVGEAKLLISYYSATAFLIHVLVAVLCFHVLAGKYALLELEINAVLAENFGEQMALHLFNKVEDGVSKYEITLVSRMCMQI